MRSTLAGIGLGAAISGVMIAAPRVRAQETVSIRASDGGEIVADEYGAGERAVVLAHGGRFDRRSWQPQAVALAALGFRVVALDFRAAVETRAGRETPCLYDATCLARDVLAVVEYLRKTGARDVFAVGASLGGGAVAQAAADAPRGTIARVVLIAHMPIAIPERIPGRKLLLLARHDSGPGDVPRLRAIEEQFRQASEPKRLVILEGSAHAQFLFASPEGERAMREIVQFLTEK
jgi:alpha-beta hydrolase superfamily lysophospholipase